MALKDTVKDPLNWALLIVAAAFAYYVMMVPYWQNLYLKQEPQVLTLQEYMDNPSHPRPWMLRTLGAPPSSIEVMITGLTVKHIDPDSITLTSGAVSAGNTAGVCEMPTMLGDEQAPPLYDILVAGENLDLKELSEGQQVSLQVFGLSETDMGWVPLEPTLDQDQEQQFSKDELDALELMRIHSNGNEITIPYVEVGELRLADGVHGAGEPMALVDLADDTDYITTTNRLAGSALDLHSVRLVDWEQSVTSPYFIVEDAEGHRAHVFFNQRLLQEWRWALDKLEGQCVVVRGTLRQVTPAELRQLESDGNVQAMIEGYALISPDGAIVINLDNPSGALGG